MPPLYEAMVSSHDVQRKWLHTLQGPSREHRSWQTKQTWPPAVLVLELELTLVELPASDAVSQCPLLHPLKPEIVSTKIIVVVLSPPPRLPSLSSTVTPIRSCTVDGC